MLLSELAVIQLGTASQQMGVDGGVGTEEKGVKGGRGLRRREKETELERGRGKVEGEGEEERRVGELGTLGLLLPLPPKLPPDIQVTPLHPHIGPLPPHLPL